MILTALPTAETGQVGVSIITGFLGSGKTTLLNRLLAQPDMSGVAVIINEFGAVPLDNDLIDIEAGGVATLPNGCLCCLARDDLEVAIESLSTAADGRLRAIVIETSGLADPAPIAQLVKELPLSNYTLALDAVVTTVDAQHVAGQLERHVECRRQIAFADRLVLTKTDLLGDGCDEAVLARLRELNPHAELLTLPFGLETLLEPPQALMFEAKLVPAGCADGCAHSHDISSLCLTHDDPIEWAAFDAWFRQLRRSSGGALLRVKGLLNIAGLDAPVAVDAIHQVAYPPRRLRRWPSADTRSRLVFILQGMAGAAIEEDWARFRSNGMRVAS